MLNGCGMSSALVTLTPHDERRVAVRAGCDPRSVRAFLRGRRQRSTVVARIQEALQALGFDGTSQSARP